jgi:hypothetical protein
MDLSVKTEWRIWANTELMELYDELDIITEVKKDRTQMVGS